MDSGRPEQVESEDGLGNQSVLFGEWVVKVNGHKDGNKVILECNNGTFCCTGPVFHWRNPLKAYVVFLEGFLEST